MLIWPFRKHSLNDYIFRQAWKFVLTKNHWRYHWRKLITIFRNSVCSRKFVLQVSYIKTINTTDQLTSPPVFFVCFWPRLMWLLKPIPSGLFEFPKVWKDTKNKTPERQTTLNIQRTYTNTHPHALDRVAERLFFKSKSVAATSLSVKQISTITCLN